MVEREPGRRQVGTRAGAGRRWEARDPGTWNRFKNSIRYVCERGKARAA
jgi:hypothetical protein